MSKKKRDFLLFLEDIDECISKIQQYTKGMVFEEFKGNKLVIDAVARNFEIIGEAVKNVPKQIKDKYPAVEWKEAAGFRDIPIHEYFGIDVEALWDTIHNNIDGLKSKIISILRSEHNPWAINCRQCPVLSPAARDLIIVPRFTIDDPRCFIHHHHPN